MSAPASPREVRRAAGVSLRSVAEAVGVNVNTVLKWEHGTARPTVEHARKWRRVTEALAREPGPLAAPQDPAPGMPLTHQGRREWLAAAGARAARARCGISLQAIATALGVAKSTVQKWETGAGAPSGARGVAYCRVIAGLIRHLEVPEDWDGEALAAAREDAVYACHLEFPDGLLLGADGLVQPVPVKRPRVSYPSPEAPR